MAEAGLANGFEMRLGIANNPLTISIAQFIYESLKEININVLVELYVFDELVTSLNTNPPAAFLSSVYSPSTQTSILYPLSDFFFYDENMMPFRYNVFNNQSPEIRTLLSELMNLNEHDNRRILVYKKLAEAVYEKAMVIPLFQKIDLHLLNRAFTVNVSDSFLFSDIRFKR